MNDHDLAGTLLKDHFTATAALVAVVLKNLPDDVGTYEEASNRAYFEAQKAAYPEYGVRSAQPQALHVS